MDKKFTITILLLLITITGYAQALYPVSFEQKTAEATLIVEATVKNGESFWNPAHTMIYTAWDLEIYKVFKGELQAANIQVITQGGTVGDEGIYTSDLLRLQTGNTGVFLLHPTQAALPSSRNIALHYDVSASSQGFLKYNEGMTDGAHAPFAHYTQIGKDLYPALQKVPGSTYREIKPLPEHGKTAAKGTATITGWSPLRVHAGALLDAANNTLTITGTGFGTKTGSAAVAFDDADDGAGGNYITIPQTSPLITSWSNTQIVIKVPQEAGTGLFRVYDNTGALVANSASNLIVDYSVMTADFGTGPLEVNMMNTDGAGGYSIAYSTNTAGSAVNMLTSPAFGAFQRALKTHRETGGMNFRDSTGASINTTTVQTINGGAAPNLVAYDNSNTGLGGPLPSGVLAVCYSGYSRCSGGAARRTGFDVLIRNNNYTTDTTTVFAAGPCPPVDESTGKLDLETVIFHELGHAANQNHVNEDYQYAGGGYPGVNPAAVMNYALLNGVRRISFDNPLLTGETYARTAKGQSYGSCTGAPFTEMIPLATNISARDECSGLFPAATLVSGSAIPFDLVRANANKNSDPQYTALRTTGAGTNVTNTQYYAFRTPASTTTVNLTISGYTTTPGTLSSCGSDGVELALYAVSSCPTGQSFPTPVAHRTFTGDGIITAFSGLTGGTDYLMLADGLENTKATFNANFSFTIPLPVTLLRFTGRTQGRQHLLEWAFGQHQMPATCILERSKDGKSFSMLYDDQTIVTEDAYTDIRPLAGTNYYRLRMADKDGSVSYSNIVVLEQKGPGEDLWLSPVPARNEAVLHLTTATNTTVHATLYHINGTKTASWQWQGYAGENTFTMDIAALPSGYYMLQVEAGKTPVYLKLVKQ